MKMIKMHIFQCQQWLDSNLPTLDHWSIVLPMEQHALKNVNNCWNANISFYFETSGGQNSYLHRNAVHF